MAGAYFYHSIKVPAAVQNPLHVECFPSELSGYLVISFIGVLLTPFFHFSDPLDVD